MTSTGTRVAVAIVTSSLFLTRSNNAEDPSPDLGCLAHLVFQLRIGKGREGAVHIRVAEPGRDGIGVVLVLIAGLAGKSFAPQLAINFRHRRSSGRNLPTIKGPEMKTRAKMGSKIAQPWQSAMS